MCPPGNDQNLSDTHNIFHNINDAIRSWAFRVKALVKVVKHPIVIHGFNCTRNINLRTLFEGLYFR